MKAQNESEVLAHMGASYLQLGRQLSGYHKQWVVEKAKAFELVAKRHEERHGGRPEYWLDVGIGEQAAWFAFPDFVEGRLYYMGVDACDVVLKDAQERCRGMEHVELQRMPFTELVETGAPHDVIVALDVLYHIHDDEMYERMHAWLFNQSADYVVTSYATDQSQGFCHARKPGDGGFAWFPRKFVAPEGWRVLHTARAKSVQRQELAVLERI